MIKKIISGGQTGVDRAALDAAIQLHIHYGGWCPKGRIDENGMIPPQYTELNEINGDFDHEKDNYAERTRRNIRDSDGTLIFVPALPMPAQIKDGTVLTLSEVKNQNKPNLILGLNDDPVKNSEKTRIWLSDNKVQTLNVAGPRESSSPGIYLKSLGLLKQILVNLQEKNELSHRNRSRL